MINFVIYFNVCLMYVITSYHNIKICKHNQEKHSPSDQGKWTRWDSLSSCQKPALSYMKQL